MVQQQRIISGVHGVCSHFIDFFNTILYYVSSSTIFVATWPFVGLWHPLGGGFCSGSFLWGSRKTSPIVLILMIDWFSADLCRDTGLADHAASERLALRPEKILAYCCSLSYAHYGFWPGKGFLRQSNLPPRGSDITLQSSRRVKQVFPTWHNRPSPAFRRKSALNRQNRHLLESFFFSEPEKAASQLLDIV